MRITKNLVLTTSNPIKKGDEIYVTYKETNDEEIHNVSISSTSYFFIGMLLLWIPLLICVGTWFWFILQSNLNQ